MRYGLKWLGDYCPLFLDPRTLAETLTLAGFEVEGIEQHGADTVFDVEVVPVRSDCLSMIGLAREIAFLTNAPLTLPPAFFAEAPAAPADQVPIALEAPDLCPRYSARIVKDLKVGLSPAWLTERLEAAGIRALNNVVDITNFVNLEMGQPLHAFDIAKIRGRRIVVRRARAGEPLTLLDGTALKLSAGDLVIADGDGAVALAGVMGGGDSEVGTGTTAVLIESAHFQPVSIRRTARRYGLSTESSYRFERGTDPAQTLAAADRAAALMAEIAGGTVLGPAADEGQRDWPCGQLRLRSAYANRLIGTDLAEEEIADLLRRLYFGVTLDQRENLLVTVPTWRRDVTAEVDLVEEVARAYGYNELQATLPTGSPPEPVHNPREEFEHQARALLNAAGFDETFTPSFTNPTLLKELGYDGAEPVAVMNPVASQYSHMRPALWPQLAEIGRRNGLLGVPGIRFFEIGAVFGAGAEGAVVEGYHLAALCAGEAEPRHWGRTPGTADYYLLRGALEALARSLHEECAVAGGELSLGPARGIYRELDLEPFGKAYVFELDAAPLAALGAGPTRPYEAIPRFPAVSRDLALIIKSDIAAAEVIKAAREADKLAREVTVFDVFAGKDIPAGHRSLGIRIRYQAADRTLTDDEVNAARDRAAAALQERFGATLRR